MAINIKLSSVETAEFTPLAEGWYDAVIHAIRVTETGPLSKNPGDPQLAVTFRLVEEPNVNRRLFAYYTLVPDTEDHKGMIFTKRFCNGIGAVDGDGDIQLEPKDHIGQAVELYVGIQPWNGADSNRVLEVQSR